MSTEQKEKTYTDEQILEMAKKTWYCTIFKKKNNKALGTIKIMWDFTEDHGKAYCIKDWLMGKVNPKTIENIINFANGKQYLNKEAEELMDNFDKKYRVLIKLD